MGAAADYVPTPEAEAELNGALILLQGTILPNATIFYKILSLLPRFAAASRFSIQAEGELGWATHD